MRGGDALDRHFLIHMHRGGGGVLLVSGNSSGLLDLLRLLHCTGRDGDGGSGNRGSVSVTGGDNGWCGNRHNVTVVTGLAQQQLEGKRQRQS